MNEIITTVMQKIGVSETQARTAVDTVLGFVKDRLPAPIAEQVEGVLNGEGIVGGLADGLGDVAKGIGGMLGGDRK